jgi:hypothetical protein
MQTQLIEYALIEAAASAGDKLASIAADTLTAFDVLRLEHAKKGRADHAAAVAIKLDQITAFAALIECELLRRYGVAPSFH